MGLPKLAAPQSTSRNKMANGEMPTYSYRPAVDDDENPQLRTCTAARARLFAGGTYFRTRQTGKKGNLLSVEVIEYVAPSAQAGEAVCVVTNYNVTSETVTGSVTSEILDIQLNTNEKIVIDQLDQPLARARGYSISFKIAPAPQTVTELGQFSLSKLFSVPGMLVAKFTPATPVFTPADEIVITPVKRVYQLVKILVTPKTPAGSLVAPPPYYGWDIADLRTKINETNPWIQMLTRSGPINNGTGPSTVNPNIVDVNDNGQDAPALTPFAEVRLAGGDGLPATPGREATGPTRSLIFVNYGEKYDGSLGEINKIYEWAGNSAQEGTWKSY